MFHVSKAALVAAAALGLGGCGLDYRLTIDNVDHDPVRIVVNGEEFGQLVCTDPPIVLTPMFGRALPWEVEVIDQATGNVIGGSVGLDGAAGRQTLLIRDFGLVLVPPTDPVPAVLSSVRRDCPAVPPNAVPGALATT